MAIDIEAIRRKLEQLNGKKTYVNTWKPKEVGTTKVRMLPWPSKVVAEGSPFIERFFYYIGNEQVLAPKQFGEEDPIEAVASQLWKSKKPEDKDAAKKLFAKMTAYVAILVKGEEDKGAQLMKLSPVLYKRLLGFILDEDVGDFLAIEDGYDMKIIATDNGRKFNGKPQLDTTIDTGKQCHLNKWFNGDNEKMQEVLDNLPSVDELTKGARKTSAEIKMILDKWLAGDEGEDKTVGVTRGQTVAKELDDLVEESSKTPTKVEDKSDASKKLDDAFDELMNDD